MPLSHLWKLLTNPSLHVCPMSSRRFDERRYLNDMRDLVGDIGGGVSRCPGLGADQLGFGGAPVGAYRCPHRWVR